MKSSKFKVQSSKFNTRGSNFENENQRPKTKDQNQKTASVQSSAVILGVLPVLEALRAGGRRVEKILIAEGAGEKRLQEIYDLARTRGVRFERTARQNLAKFAGAADANHQGVVALVAAADYADADALFDAITGKENSLSVILDGVEDPRNLGAVLRAVECAGADGVFLPERRAASLTDAAAKSSAGATEYVKVAKVSNLNRLIERLKEKNVWVVGTSADAALDYTDWDWTRATALVLGGEGRGLHRLTAEKCDALLRIPMRGRIESLNVSVACGVILFEAVRQRKKMKSGEWKAEN